MTATTNDQTTTANGAVPDPQTVQQQPSVEASQDDMAPIMPDPTTLEIEGIPIAVRRIKSREFFTVVRIITNGMGPAITSIRLDPTDREAMQSSLMAILMYAVPNAIDDFGVFLTQIVEPRNPKQRKDLDKVMENPEIDTLFDVLAVMVEQEQDDFRSLMGKAQAWISKITSQPTG